MPRSNKLLDLPDELAELQQLRVLRCKYNSLARLPAVLSQLPLLETLVLPGNLACLSFLTKRLTVDSLPGWQEHLMHKFLLWSVNIGKMSGKYIAKLDKRCCLADAVCTDLHLPE